MTIIQIRSPKHGLLILYNKLKKYKGEEHMTNFTDVIDEYIDKKIRGTKEKEKLRKLLLVDLKQYLKDKLSYNINVEYLL